MSEISSASWTEADASNTSPTPNGWPEGQSPSSVNDCGRMMMGAVKRFWTRINGAYSSAGSANAYTLDYSSNLPAYVTGERYSFRANFRNTGSATLNIDGLGAKAIRKFGGTGKVALDAGDIQSGQPVTVEYDGTDMILVTAYAMPVPSGVIVPFAGAVAPADWLLCYGQAVSRTTYATLFAILGTTYGAGDGSTTFNVPDLRGRAVFGKDDMGGTASSRVTSGVSGIAGATLGAAGGSQSMQQHSHSFNFNVGSAASTISGGTFFNSAAATYNSVTAETGAGASQNMPPAIILNYIVKT